jgi:hypothetical protein
MTTAHPARWPESGQTGAQDHAVVDKCRVRRLTELRQDMLGHFDAIYHRFERLEQEYYAITEIEPHLGR